ncbi:MAG: DUF4351 domain-containing protein [Alcaligenaceae bacterium]|nr:DUF4351 domain-containing protein [Alcaligenaceae bacterium]
MADLIPRTPGLVADYLPRLKYLLIDENEAGPVDLGQVQNLMAAIIQVERPDSDRALLRLIDLLSDWLSGNPELRRTFAIWIRAVVLRQSRHTLVLPKVRDLKELKMTLPNRFDAWAQQYEEKGLEKGIAKGEALVLQRLLAKRFGPLSSDAVQMISSASAEQVDAWLDRLLDAHSLDDVLHF